MRIFLWFALAVMMSHAVHAETLQEALARSYQESNTLNKERARLRAIDEQVPLAKAGARPSADVNANVGYAVSDTQGTQSNTRPRGFGVNVTQPLYRGGAIDAGISAAEHAVLAQRAALVNAEQVLFSSVVSAYVDVARDQQVLRLNKKNEDVLRQELKAASDRLRVGEATRTDKAQAESRYAKATADRIESEGRLAISKAVYERVTHRAPIDLVMPQPDFALPKTLDDAIATARANHPLVITARYTEDGAKDDVEVARGALLPQLNLEASGSENWDSSPILKQQTTSAQVMARVTVPLYRAGADYAKIRAAKETASQRRIEVHQAMNKAKEDAVRAWENLQSSRTTITARKKQVEAAVLAYEGVKQESQVGTRTVLDRLNAEAESLQARVNLVQAEHDYVTAMFDLKAAVGELTAADLKLPVELYDSSTHYEGVKDSWIGLGADDNSPIDESAVEVQESEQAAAQPAALLPGEKEKVLNLKKGR